MISNGRWQGGNVYRYSHLATLNCGGEIVNVMIPAKLFYQLYGHFVLDMTGNEEEIKKQIIKKNDSIINHYLYTKSKTAETEEEREQARREYLESVGIRPDFRY